MIPIVQRGKGDSERLTDLPRIIQRMTKPEFEPSRCDFTAPACNHSHILPSYKSMEIISLCKSWAQQLLNSALTTGDPPLNFTF